MTTTEPIQLTAQEIELKGEFKALLEKFSEALLEKLMANERKYEFGNAWKIPDWEDHLHREIVEHVQKGDPRDTAIYSLFAWYHGWKTAPVGVVEKIETFTCRQCQCELPTKVQLRTEDYCYLCDPAISVDELLATEPVKIGCVDGGVCHHNCIGNRQNDCYRRQSCAPIGDYAGEW